MASEQTMFLQESINISISISDLCHVFCDPANKSGFCPTRCLSVCSSICHYSLSSLIPSPPYTPTSFTPSSSHRSTIFHRLFPFLIVTLAVLVTAFVLVCHYSIYVKLRSRRARLPSVDNDRMAPDEFVDEERGPELDHPIWYIRTVGLQSSVISAITVCKYKKGDGLVEGTDCAVCLNEFEEDETLRLLPKCNHAFHIPCIDTWLRSHTNCPICRAGIVVNNVVISPSPQLNVDHLGVSAETHEEILDSDNQSDVESESPVERIQNLKEGVSGILPMRRSVSMNSTSDSMISLDLATMLSLQSDDYLEKELAKVSESNTGTSSKIPVGSQNLVRLTGSCSVGRSSENGSGPMKRSLSCTGKFLLSKYSRSKNSTLPL